MTANLKGKKNDLIVRLQQIAAAAKQYYANKTIVIRGKPWKTVDLVSLVLGHVTAMQSADALHASWLSTVEKNREDYATQIAPVVAGLKVAVDAQFGPKSDEFRAFGFAKPKTPQNSLVTKVAAVAQNLATRAARHTLGKKQRQAVKGVVQTPATPATATPSSAPSGTNGTNGTNGTSR